MPTPLSRPLPATFKLSPHFAWGEFWEAGRLAPAEALLPHYRKLCVMYLEPLRRAFGVCTVHSGYRSPAHNAAVGGAPRSTHMANWAPPAVAADVSFRSGTPQEWFAAARDLGPGGLGLYSTHVHVDTRSGTPARW